MATLESVLRALNNTSTGPLDRILQRIEAARQDLISLEQPELAEKLAEARKALLSGDEPLFQKRIAHVTSRLGHLK